MIQFRKWFKCAATLAVMKAEGTPHPQLAAMGVSVSASPDLPGGNLEGKELRFGPDETALFAAEPRPCTRMSCWRQ